MTPELRHLRYFVAVAEELNFTRAAERLHIAQPSLSAQITELEKRVGFPLFDRDTRRVELTAPGRAVLAQARRVLAAAAELDATLNDLAAGGVVSGPLKLLVGPDTEPYVASDLAAFAAAYPDVQLLVVPSIDSDICEAVAAGRTDAGVVWRGSAHGEPDSLQRTTIRDVETSLAVHADDPLAALDVIPLAATVDRPLIMFPREFGPGVWDVLMAQLRPGGQPGPSEVVASVAGNQQEMLRAVAAGRGITPTTPAHVRALALPEVVVRPTSPPLRTALDLVTKPPRSAVKRALTAYLTERAAES